MIQQTILGFVQRMTTNAGYNFAHSERDWQNILSDETMGSVVYLDMPVRYTTVTYDSGYKEKTYICTILFLIKSELDDDPDQQYITFEKAEVAADEFENIVSNSHDIVSKFKVGECYQIQNVTDANRSGIIMPFSISLRNTNSVCE